MKTRDKLNRILNLREHRSLIARQHLMSTRMALEAAQRDREREENELHRRQDTLSQSERAAVRLASQGASGGRFDDFLAHARLVRERITQQRTAVETAQQAVDDAQQRERDAQAAHALARKAEEKTRQFQDTVHARIRVLGNVMEADQLDEITELQRDAPQPEPQPAVWELMT